MNSTSQENEIPMNSAEQSRRINATHSILYQAPEGMPLRYFGWPTVARLDDGSLLAAASGFRLWHVCPYGRTVIWRSHDEGKTWTPPVILNDTPLDDRDAGVCPLPNGDALVSWFVSDLRSFRQYIYDFDKETGKQCDLAFSAYNENIVKMSLGSYVRRIHPDGTADAPIAVQVSAPHGPVRLHDGALLYLGIPFAKRDDDGTLHFSMENYNTNEALAIRSDDGGRSWKPLGGFLPPTETIRFSEPHLVELPDGKLIGAIRDDSTFTIWQSESADGGHTWTKPKKIIESGAPPHLMRHSTGVLILSYGYRKEPFGQRIAFSRDNGKTWETDWILRDDGPSADLGYPSTVELSDGSLFTIYYQQLKGDKACSILSSHWTLPE